MTSRVGEGQGTGAMGRVPRQGAGYRGKGQGTVAMGQGNVARGRVLRQWGKVSEQG